MTAVEHIRVGAVLGFPACCIAQFIEPDDEGATQRDTIVGRRRSAAEIAALTVKLAAMGIERPERFFTGSERITYVPCWSCRGQQAARKAS